MSEDLKLMIAVLIKNTICLALWILLAIMFNKWWISLFSALFWSGVKNRGE